MAFVRGIRFGQVDKRMVIADKGTDSWKATGIWGTPPLAQMVTVDHSEKGVPQDALIIICQEIVVTMQSHGSINVNGAPAGCTVCIFPHGKQKPWVCERIKYQAAT